MRTLIDRTGQKWKEIASYMLILSVPLPKFITDYLPGIFLLVLPPVFLVSGILLFASIRCPSCGMRWAWHSVSKISIRKLATWLPSQKQCPECSFKPEEKA